MIEVLNAWLKDSGRGSVTEDMLPATFVLNDDAVGFLIETDTDVAFIEYIVGNPASSRRNVRNGISEVIKNLVQIAKSKGYRRVIGITDKSGIVGIAKENDFQKYGEFIALRRAV